MSVKFKLLSLDGGGVRGIIAAIILSELEKRVGRPLCETFDMIAGTSTGGILALALAKPDPSGAQGGKKPHYTAGELVRLYEQRGKDIFRHRMDSRFIVREAIVPLSPYRSKDRWQVFEDYFWFDNGAARLSQALTGLFVPSYCVESNRPVFFVDRRPRDLRNLRFEEGWILLDRVSMSVAAMATSSAPTYFEPYELFYRDNQRYVLADGGLVANNPALLALAYVLDRNPGLGYEDVLVVSVGTGFGLDPLGYYAKKKDRFNDKPWSPIDWAGPLLDTMFSQQGKTVDYLAERVLNAGVASRYYRFQPRLEAMTVEERPRLIRPNKALDAHGEETIEQLKYLATRYVEENFDEEAEQLLPLLKE